MVLKRDFFNRSTPLVAKSLLGKYLCRRLSNGSLRLPITEVEAYDGFADEASHAHRGKTERNAVMFGPGGCWYVYLCYGVHWLLNIVAGPENYPAAILIRGAGNHSGPGRLTKALQIDKSFDRLSAIPSNKLWIEESDLLPSPLEIQETPRIGVNYAAPSWREKPWRFLWKR